MCVGGAMLLKRLFLLSGHHQDEGSFLLSWPPSPCPHSWQGRCNRKNPWGIRKGLDNHEKEGSADTCFNMNEHWKHHAK